MGGESDGWLCFAIYSLLVSLTPIIELRACPPSRWNPVLSLSSPVVIGASWRMAFSQRTLSLPSSAN